MLNKLFSETLPSKYISKTSSDKTSIVIHDYSDLYDMVFGTLLFLHGAPLKVLEIGVSKFGYGSGHAFSDMPYVEKFVGIDVESLSTPFSDKGTFIQCDAYDETDFKEKIVPHGPFHLLIDDGSHTKKDQETFFKLYRFVAAVPSIMVCEDVRTTEKKLMYSVIKKLDNELSSSIVTVPTIEKGNTDNNAILLIKFS